MANHALGNPNFWPVCLHMQNANTIRRYATSPRRGFGYEHPFKPEGIREGPLTSAVCGRRSTGYRRNEVQRPGRVESYTGHGRFTSQRTTPPAFPATPTASLIASAVQRKVGAPRGNMNQPDWNNKPVYMGVFDLSEWSVVVMLRLLRRGRIITLYDSDRWPWRRDATGTAQTAEAF